METGDHGRVLATAVRHAGEERCSEGGNVTARHLSEMGRPVAEWLWIPDDVRTGSAQVSFYMQINLVDTFFKQCEENMPA